MERTRCSRFAVRAERRDCCVDGDGDGGGISRTRIVRRVSVAKIKYVFALLLQLLPLSTGWAVILPLCQFSLWYVGDRIGGNKTTAFAASQRTILHTDFPKVLVYFPVIKVRAHSCAFLVEQFPVGSPLPLSSGSSSTSPSFPYRCCVSRRRRSVCFMTVFMAQNKVH